MSPTAPAAAASPPKFKRSAKNYLLDRNFQLKYTGYIVGVTALVSLALGALLYVQSEKTVALGIEAVQVGQEANKAGQEANKAGLDAVAQSDALNKKLEMDAMMSYGDNPSLLESIKSANKDESDKIAKRASALASSEKSLAAKSESLAAKSDAIARQRVTLLATLGAGMLLFVIFLGLAGIVITHKIAGPIYKMKRLLNEVGDGKLTVPGKLRKGDELQDFFDVFATMVEKLRVAQEKEIELLDGAIVAAKSGSTDTSKLETLRAQMQADLDKK